MIPSWIFKITPEKMQGKVYNKFFNTKSVHTKHNQKFLKANLKYAPDVSLYELKIGDVISGNIAFTGVYETELSKRISDLAKTGGTLLDIGANIGYFTSVWLANNSNNKSICFEASPKVFKLLENNITKNDFNSRATIHPLAAGNEKKKVHFDIGPEEQTGWGGIINEEHKNNQSIEVQMERIDQLIDCPIDVLKIDIEGAELFAFQGCQKLFENKRIKTIFFENNIERMKKLNITPEEVQTLLEGYGFEVQSYVQHNGQGIDMVATLRES